MFDMTIDFIPVFFDIEPKSIKNDFLAVLSLLFINKLTIIIVLASYCTTVSDIENFFSFSITYFKIIGNIHTNFVKNRLLKNIRSFDI